MLMEGRAAARDRLRRDQRQAHQGHRVPRGGREAVQGGGERRLRPHQEDHAHGGGEEAREQLCQTITKLALTSKAADNVMKTIKVVENTCLNNEVTIEELDKNLRATVKMASDNEQKLDELSRKLGVQEAELKRAVERAELA